MPLWDQTAKNPGEICTHGRQAIASLRSNSGLMRLYRESPGYRCYHVTEKGADAVGLWLPEE
jgi:hypothetical protein